MESEFLRAVFLPEHGAKLCSLVYKQTGREYVYQGKTDQYKTARYGQSFLAGECAGVDQMFPTIDAYCYDRDPWKGTELPDHGEVWALPWEYRIQGERLVMKVEGIKLPYYLKLTATLKDGNTVHLEYEVRNRSSFSMEYIWAAHMMLQAEKGCRFEFDKELKRAYAVMSDSGDIGKIGDIFSYPLVKRKDGTIYDASIYRGDKADDYQKFYFADKLKSHQGWGSICYPDQSRLKIVFPANEVPYLGAIQAEGGSLDLRCMFLEPCTGAFDSPQKAREYGMDSILSPEEKKNWFLDIQIEKGNVWTDE